MTLDGHRRLARLTTYVFHQVAVFDRSQQATSIVARDYERVCGRITKERPNRHDSRGAGSHVLSPNVHVLSPGADFHRLSMGFSTRVHHVPLWRSRRYGCATMIGTRNVGDGLPARGSVGYHPVLKCSA